MRITGVSLFQPSRSLLGGQMRQRGIALAVALFLLILITLIGLVAIRGATVQQRMTANFYDRQIAFQNAEAALRAGQAALSDVEHLTADDYRVCDGSQGTCEANPFTDSALDGKYIKTVATGTDIAAGQYTAGNTAPGQPQFVIELICADCTAPGASGESQSANCSNYGACSDPGVVSADYYRITARSGDPGIETGANRATVTLQAMFESPTKSPASP